MKVTRMVVGMALVIAAPLLGVAPAPAQVLPTGEPPGQVGGGPRLGPRCAEGERLKVPGAVEQLKSCLGDLTTAGTQRTGHTNTQDWEGLNADGTRNPTGIKGIQVDGFFPDTSTTNTNNGFNRDAQFVIRLPEKWNGKLVITPGLQLPLLRRVPHLPSPEPGPAEVHGAVPRQRGAHAPARRTEAHSGAVRRLTEVTSAGARASGAR